ncbi:MAG TPA: helix-turn-helix transcriptional regulator, partial [Casimicrobiaceae bacterium]
MTAVPAATPLRHPQPTASEEAVLSKAVVRAARLLGLTQREVAEVLGVSVATASRLFADRYRLSSERT